jgi:hypothetical protein
MRSSDDRQVLDPLTGFIAHFYTSRLHFTGYYHTQQRPPSSCLVAASKGEYSSASGLTSSQSGDYLKLSPYSLQLVTTGNSFGCWLPSRTELDSNFRPPTTALNSLLTGFPRFSSWVSERVQRKMPLSTIPLLLHEVHIGADPR